MYKRSLKANGHDEWIEAALEELCKKKFKSINAAAKAYGLSEATLRVRKNRRKSRAEANEMKQALLKGEEKH